MTGTSPDDIEYMKGVYGQRFNDVVNDYMNKTSAPNNSQVTLQSDTYAVRTNEMTGEVEIYDPLLKISQGNIDWMKGYLKPGMVILTKDAKNVVRHGHAGIVYDANQSIEALGPDKLSQMCDINYWKMFS